MNKTLLNKIFVTSIVFLLTLSSLPVLAVRAHEENTWIDLAPMQTARARLGTTIVNNKIYAIGGSSTSLTGNLINYDTIFYSARSTNEEYNPETNTWTNKAPMPTPRSQFGIAVYNDKIYCIGGYNNNDRISRANEVYDPITDTWETKKSMITPRVMGKLSIVDNKIYCIGGRTGGSFEDFSLANEVYDPETDSWEKIEPLPYQNTCYDSTVFNNEIYLICRTPNSSILFMIYNTSSNSWREGPTSPIGGFSASIGVTTGQESPARIYFIDESWMYIYDPLDQTWFSQKGTTGSGYCGIAVIEDEIYVIGGMIAPFSGYMLIGAGPTNSLTKYNPYRYGSIPNISISSPENTFYDKSSVLLKFIADDSLTWIGYSLDNQKNVTITPMGYRDSWGLRYETNITNLSGGIHHLTVFVRDMANDENFSNVTFTVDQTPPIIKILEPTNKTYTSPDIDLDFWLSEPVANLTYSLDGVNNTLTGNSTFTGLVLGEHNLTLFATDYVGFDGKSLTVYFSVEESVLFESLVATVLIACFCVALLVMIKFRSGKQ